MLCCAQKASIVGNMEKETFECSGKEKRFYVVFEFEFKGKQQCAREYWSNLAHSGSC